MDAKMASDSFILCLAINTCLSLNIMLKTKYLNISNAKRKFTAFSAINNISSFIICNNSIFNIFYLEKIFDFK